MLLQHLLALAAITIGVGNAQDPNGDQLFCYNSYYHHHSLACLGATTTDTDSYATGRQQKAGELYRTPCVKQPEETWVVVTENGTPTLRLKSDTTYCLTIDGTYGPPRLLKCTPNNIYQRIDFLPVDKGYDHPDYKYYDIRNPFSGYYLMHDLKHNAIVKDTQANYANAQLPAEYSWYNQTYTCAHWVWVSDIEAKAKPYRNTAFTFPIKGLTNQLRSQYRYAFFDSLMHSTPAYPKVNITIDTCKQCTRPGPCNCFPIDYDPSTFEWATVTLDLNIHTGGASENYRTKNRIPTGRYAKPNEPMWVYMGEYDTSKVTIIASLYLHDDGKGYKEWFRPPWVTYREILTPGKNKLKSPFGGPLTLEVLGRDAKTVKADVYGVPMATFTLGQTTKDSWANEVKKSPSWITIQGEHVIGLDVKAPYVSANFSQMVAMVKRLDLMMKNNYLISGYDFDQTEPEHIHAVPQGWNWWSRDAAGQNPHAGNPIVTPQWHDEDIVLSFNTWNQWLFGHEFGHGMQTRCYSDAFGGETTNNIYSAFHPPYFCGDGKQTDKCNIWLDPSTDFLDGFNKLAKPMLAANKTYEDMRDDYAWTPLPFWIQLLKVYGYEPIRNMHRRFREKLSNPNDPVCFSDDKYAKFDAVYETLCDTTSQDLTKHFDTYKVPLSNAVRQRVLAKKYPKPSVDISNEQYPVGTPMTWKPSGQQPSYAMPVFKSIKDAQ